MLGNDMAGALPSGPFAGVEVFAQLVRDALAQAAREAWPMMIWSDATFQDWPLRERSVVDSLQEWAGKGRRLVMLAGHYDDVRRLHPRFVTWRQTWDHIIECRVCKGLEATAIPSALWSPVWAMRRLDLVRCSGSAGYDSQRRVLLKEEIDEHLRQSSPGFSATTLGL
jgi:hypothetical protein